MEIIIIVALLASNLYLIGKVLRKPDFLPPPATDNNPNVDVTPAKGEQKHEDTLVGRSHVDMTRINAIIEARVARKVEGLAEEIYSEIVTELTSPGDVGLPQEDFPDADLAIPQERLDEAFTHHTVSEALGDSAADDEQDWQEPVSSGLDFNSLDSAVRVARDEPHTPQEAAEARETLSAIQGTEIADRIAIDPKVRTRILSIIYGDPDEPLTKETLATKKTVYSKTIDTSEIDRINFNILT